MNGDSVSTQQGITFPGEHDQKACEEQPYDVSFAYSFRWRSPDELREALKVLLLSNQTERLAPQAPKPVSENRKAMEEEAARIRWLLAINPNTPPPVLEHLSREQHAPLLERIAENPRTHGTTLARLASHQDAQVRAAAAENLNLPIKFIWKLSKDECPDVRLRLAESYIVPVAVLKVLCYDENPYVAERANKTLRRIIEEVAALRTA